MKELFMVGKVTPNTMLSASRLPAVMGYSKYRSPNDELSFSIDALGGKEPEDIGNEAMQWGNHLEPIVLRECAKRLHATNLQTEFIDAFFHPNLPLCCSLDGTADGMGATITSNPEHGIYVVGQDDITLDGPGILEAKVTKMAPEDVLPLYRGPIQLQAQMDITGAKWGAVAVLYQASELRIFLFAPHESTIRAIHLAALDFQRRLNTWTSEKHIDYYPPVNSEDANRTWPDGTPETVFLAGEFEQYARDIHEAKQDIKQCEAIINDRETKIKEAMQQATQAKIGKYTVSWPMRSYKATEERIVPAKAAYSVRQSTLTVKENKEL
jgi:predicted phage-related endonuclease